MHTWNLVPLSSGQLTDVNPADVFDGGNLRICHTYKGGGGYDDFPEIARDRGLVEHPDDASVQLVVQLRGCNLDCPYCYVTRAGVWGKPVQYTTDELVALYAEAKRMRGANVFHLMGGAPALQLKFWPELLDALGPDVIFHSDLMLSESVYAPKVIAALDRPNVLLAVSVKGTTDDEWQRNTRTSFNEGLLRYNMRLIQSVLPRERWYVTFTNVAEENRVEFKRRYGLDYSLDIPLIQYNAVEHVDEVPWAWNGDQY